MTRSIKLLVIVSITTFGLIMLVALGIWVLAHPTGAGAVSPKMADSALATEFLNRSTDLAQTAESRRTAYEAQLTTLQTNIGEREATYQGQVQMLDEELAAYNEAITAYQQEIQSLSAQVTELEQTLATREGTYQEQLNQLNTQLAERQAQLQRQLEEAHLALADANTQLGR